MHQKSFNCLYTWLTKAGHRVDKTKFETSFLSHPDVGGLTAITDTLKEFGVDNTAATIPLESIQNLTEPFIAFIKKDLQEQFILARLLNSSIIEIYTGDSKPFDLSIDEFKKIWGGVIIVIDKNEAQNKSDWKNYAEQNLLSFAVVGIITLFLLAKPNLSETLHFLLSCSGLFISSLIVAHEFGNKSNMVNKFCSLNASTSCDAVLNSKTANIYKEIGLSDIGIVYFSVQLAGSLLVINSNYFSSYILHTTSIIAAAFSIYSVYQQAVVIKKWCPLCLSIVAILMLQAIASIVIIASLEFPPSSISAASWFIPLALIITAVWYFIKPLLQAANKGRLLAIENLGFKRNYHLFLPFYQQQEVFDTKNLSADPEVIIGNPNAIIQLTLITNPLCAACQNTHKAIDKLLEKYKNDLSLRILFYVPTYNTNDPRCMIAAWLLNEYFNDSRRGTEQIKKWYNKPDKKVFDKMKIPLEVVTNMLPVLINHRKFCVSNNTVVTPLVLINDKLFPVFYNPADVQFFMEELIEFESQRLSLKFSNEKQLNKVLINNT